MIEDSSLFFLLLVNSGVMISAGVLAYRSIHTPGSIFLVQIVVAIVFILFSERLI